MTDKSSAEIAYKVSKDEIVKQCKYYDAIVLGHRQKIEEESILLAKAEVNLATYRYCLEKLKEDFKQINVRDEE